MQNNIFLTADLHLGHKLILDYNPARLEAMGISKELLSENPKEAIKMHDEWIINMWNSMVKRNDMVYIIGDLCLGGKEYSTSILSRLKGKKYFIRGNHDKGKNGLENYFQGIWDIKELKVTKQQFPFINEDEDAFCCELCHYPLLTWNRRSYGTCMVHGHCHGTVDDVNTKSKELRVDVGIDGKLAGYKLVPIEKLYNYFCEIKKSENAETLKEYVDKMFEKGFPAME